MEGEGHRQSWTDQKRAFDMTAVEVKPAARGGSEAVLIVPHDAAGNWEGFRVVKGETGLHAATLGETLACGLFPVGWEGRYEWDGNERAERNGLTCHLR